MRLAHLATNRMVITRMTSISGYKRSYTTTTYGNINLQGLTAENVALMGGVLGKTYRIYAESDLGIQEHDRLRDINSGYVYKVKPGGVTTHSYGAIEYDEIIIERVN